MNRSLAVLLLVLSLSPLAEEKALPYVLMQDDLAELKKDFDGAADQVRLVFIVGPT